MAKVSMKTRREIIERQRGRYQKAAKKQKGIILDSVCMDTGISRDRAARLLSDKANSKTQPAAMVKKRGRKTIYDEKVLVALKEVWVYADLICGKRLVQAMPDLLDALVRFGEVDYSADVVRKLKRISASTMDRLLKKEKERMQHKGRSTTKPGSLLKKDIPLRLGTEWADAEPGFVEIDLVAHCGASTAGEYINTLLVTDISSGWTEPAAVINKAQRHVFSALMDIKKRQPYEYRGIDSDNGSEFINEHLYRYCKQEGILFTRSRPYQKNDNCHVEQKNWTWVRQNIGYGRYEGAEALRILNEYYELQRLYTNFFLPSTKLLERIRNGAYIKKKYGKPMTPYRKLLCSDKIIGEIKEGLRATFLSLNPAALKRDMMKLLTELEKLRLP
jgi:hypothetical protein